MVVLVVVVVGEVVVVVAVVVLVVGEVVVVAVVVVVVVVGTASVGWAMVEDVESAGHLWSDPEEECLDLVVVGVGCTMVGSGKITLEGLVASAGEAPDRMRWVTKAPAMKAMDHSANRRYGDPTT